MLGIKEDFKGLLSEAEGNKAGPFVSTALALSSYLYLGGLKIRGGFYKWGLIRRLRLPVPVISLGNITMGGTGKTPAVEYLARHLASRGKKVAILSRGYAARIENNKDGKKIIFNDESRVLSENLPGVPVLLSPDRYSSGKKAAKEGADCLILDDGFQHLRLFRDLDIVVIDALNPFGGGRLLPRGTLREPIIGLRRADVFIVSHSDQCSLSILEQVYTALKSLDPGIPIVEAIHCPTCLEDLTRGIRLEPTWLKAKKIYAFCALGNPYSFENSLKNLGTEVLKFRKFLDHHFYSEVELKNMLDEAQQLRAEAVVITQKDRVKLKEIAKGPIPVLVLKIELKITKGFELLQRALEKAIHQELTGKAG